MIHRPSFSRTALALLVLAVISWNARAATSVSLGIDELERTNFSLLHGKRVGLVTNPSGADSKGRSAITILYLGQKTAGYHLTKLFGPEHGIDGLTEAGRSFSNTRDRRTGLPVYALFNTPDGNYRHPTPQMFAGLDAVIYDVQDLGNRSYTFISTLGYVMDEAAKDHVQVIVLDRPNPLGGLRIEGPRLDSSFTPSFVGLYNIPYVYGLTPGELARWINSRYLPKPCKLTVVAMKGWLRPMVWEDTGLNWIPTSPNIPTIGAARGYTATGLLGEIGIESGIGSAKPFQIVAGRNWDDYASDMARRFNALHIAGVYASTCFYHTSKGRWAGAPYCGVSLQINPHSAGNLTAINFFALDILERTIDHFSSFAHTSTDERDMFDKITGGTSIRRQLVTGRPVADIIRSWNAGVNRWAQERLPYLIYGDTPSHPISMATLSEAMSP